MLISSPVTIPGCTLPLNQWQLGLAPAPPSPLTGKAIRILDGWMLISYHLQCRSVCTCLDFEAPVSTPVLVV